MRPHQQSKRIDFDTRYSKNNFDTQFKEIKIDT